MAIRDSLVDYWNRIIGKRNAALPTERDDAGSPGDDIVRFTNFNEYTEMLFGVFPDPDEVLEKANLDASEYRKTLIDSHVAGALMQRKSRTKLSELRWEAGTDEDGKTPKEAEDALSVVRKQFDGIKRGRGLKPIINEILEAPYYGAAYEELFWNRLPANPDERPAGEIVLTNIMGKPFEWFSYTPDGELRIKTDLSSAYPRLRKIPENKILAVVKDGTYQNPYGDRVVKRVWWPYMFKKGGLRFWTEFIEKYGMPFLWGHLDERKSRQDFDDFYNGLVAMVRNGVLVTQDSASGTNKVEVVETKSRGSSTDAHSTYKNAMNIEISKAILGETLTIENSESGSQAATKYHSEQLEDLQDEDAAMVEEAFTRIASIITKLNFGPDVPSPVAYLVNEREQEERDQKVIERDSKLRKDIGVKFTKKYISDTYSLEEDDFEIGEPQTSGGGDDLFSDNASKIRDYATAEFPVQEGLDEFLDARLPQIKGITAPLAREIKRIMATSKNYDEFFVNMVQIQDKVNNGLFANVFGEVLQVYDIVGTWAVDNDKV